MRMINWKLQMKSPILIFLFFYTLQYLQRTASTSETVIKDYDESEIIPGPLTNNTDKFKDPADWTNNNIFRNYITKFGYDQNVDVDFT